ncbi:snaclec coagulation factor IX/factor X-binding protein subunit A-like [Elgaria multicarinata webbii]|uniref:snaclec coagulation factor IX/factor X-binding protein subunit A-like n=1 Tax=Elgaria multicarinata webbii TaxID=159646 RepID=UPI002FCD5BA3
MWLNSSFPLILFGLLIVSFIVPGTNGGSCPGGWMAYQNHCYGVFYEKLTWNAAEKECQSYNGHLASILSWAEADLVAWHIVSNYKRLGYVWIGLRDRWKVRQFRWADDSPVKYTAWTEFEPVFLTLSKYCVFLIDFKGYKEWSTASCQEPTAYLCKFMSS